MRKNRQNQSLDTFLTPDEIWEAGAYQFNPIIRNEVTDCIIFPCGQLGPFVARAPVAFGTPKPLADTRRVSGLPRQFGRFRPIVGPAGACFTRGV
jgi:hypothetical protein